jgi:hypothetical protein
MSEEKMTSANRTLDSSTERHFVDQTNSFVAVGWAIVTLAPAVPLFHIHAHICTQCHTRTIMLLSQYQTLELSREAAEERANKQQRRTFVLSFVRGVFFLSFCACSRLHV